MESSSCDGNWSCSYKTLRGGVYSYYRGHTGRGQQSFSPSHVCTLFRAAGIQTDWHMPKPTCACTETDGARAHTVADGPRWLRALWYAWEPVHGLAAHFSGCTVGLHSLPEERDSCAGVLFREWLAVCVCVCVYVCVCVHCGGGGGKAYAYLTPRGKFEMIQYQLNQYTPLHLAETGPSSWLPPLWRCLIILLLALNKLQTLRGFKKGFSKDLWRSVSACAREDLRW